MRLITVTAIMILAFPAAAEALDDAKPDPSASRDGRVITLHPEGLTFTIPESWVAFADRWGTNLHLTQEELDAVRDGESEWDTEFAKVVNLVLPFEHCIFHGGSEGWGLKAFVFSDLQMRVYVGERSLKEVAEAVRTKGLEKVKELSVDYGYLQTNPGYEESKKKPWHVDSLVMPLHFTDYGAVAHIDFYSQRRGDQTVTLVFMYTNYPAKQEAERNEIATSFDFPSTAQESLNE